MRLPNDFYQFSPMLILLGSIIGLSILSTYRELAVMRASGFSIRHIIISVLSAALLMILAISFIGEWAAPRLSNKATIYKDSAQNSGQALMTATGAWLHIENNFIHVQHMFGPSLLEGVTRYQFDDNHRLQTAYFAKRLIYQDKQWRMYDVVKTSFYHERTKSQALPEAPWDLKFNPNLLNIGVVQPDEMTLPKLNRFINYLKQNGLQTNAYRYQYWQRVFQPLAALIMIFLAIPFVLGALSTATLGWRIIIGIVAGFAFYMSNAFLGQLCIVYQIPPLFAALLPPLIFVILGTYLSKRILTQ
jgi:lipopolysaccharide export system permease protein